LNGFKFADFQPQVNYEATLRNVNIGRFSGDIPPEDYDHGEFDPLFSALIVALVISREKDGLGL
jgi:hypothetical protein